MVYLGEEKLPVTDGEEGGVGEASFTAGDTEGGVEERITELEGAASSESPEKEEVKLFVWVCLTAQSTGVKLSLLVHTPAAQVFVQTQPRGQLAHQFHTPEGFCTSGYQAGTDTDTPWGSSRGICSPRLVPADSEPPAQPQPTDLLQGISLW